MVPVLLLVPLLLMLLLVLTTELVAANALLTLGGRDAAAAEFSAEEAAVWPLAPLAATAGGRLRGDGAKAGRKTNKQGWVQIVRITTNSKYGQCRK